MSFALGQTKKTQDIQRKLDMSLDDLIAAKRQQAPKKKEAASAKKAPKSLVKAAVKTATSPSRTKATGIAAKRLAIKAKRSAAASVKGAAAAGGHAPKSLAIGSRGGVTKAAGARRRGTNVQSVMAKRIVTRARNSKQLKQEQAPKMLAGKQGKGRAAGKTKIVAPKFVGAPAAAAQKQRQQKQQLTAAGRLGQQRKQARQGQQQQLTGQKQQRKQQQGGRGLGNTIAGGVRKAAQSNQQRRQQQQQQQRAPIYANPKQQQQQQRGQQYAGQRPQQQRVQKQRGGRRQGQAPVYVPAADPYAAAAAAASSQYYPSYYPYSLDAATYMAMQAQAVGYAPQAYGVGTDATQAYMMQYAMGVDGSGYADPALLSAGVQGVEAGGARGGRQLQARQQRAPLDVYGAPAGGQGRRGRGSSRGGGY